MPPSIIKRKSQTYVQDENDDEDKKHREAFEAVLRSKTDIRPISTTVTKIDQAEEEELKEEAERKNSLRPPTKEGN